MGQCWCLVDKAQLQKKKQTQTHTLLRKLLQCSVGTLRFTRQIKHSILLLLIMIIITIFPCHANKSEPSHMVEEPTVTHREPLRLDNNGSGRQRTARGHGVRTSFADDVITKPDQRLLVSAHYSEGRQRCGSKKDRMSFILLGIQNKRKLFGCSSNQCQNCSLID